MEHPETRRLVSGAKYAVLFLHGIVGTPNHFRKLIPLEVMVPRDWSVYNVRYPGHGADVTGFGKSSMEQWRTHARAAFLDLAENHEKVLLVGHSMGTLFAMQLAIEFPDKVSEIFLLNVPLRPWVRFSGVVNALRIAFNRVREDRPLENCFRIACGVTTTPMIWKYLPWIMRILELFGEIIRTEKVMGQLQLPCITWQSRKDELVSNFTVPVLRNIGVMEVRELQNSTHFYYAPEDAEQICREFSRRIGEM